MFEELLAGTELSEEAKSQMIAVFQAAVTEKAAEETEKVKKEKDAEVDDAKAKMQEAIDSKDAAIEEGVAAGITEALAGLDANIDAVMSKSVDEWAIANATNIENATRVEIAEQLFEGVCGIVANGNMQVDAERSSVIEGMEQKELELVESLDSEKLTSIALRKELDEAQREICLKDATKDLTVSESEKVVALAEDIKFDDKEDFTTKVSAVVESMVKADQAKQDDIPDAASVNEETNRWVL